MSHTDKGTIRALSRRGVRSNKVTPIEAETGRLGEPTMCDRCGASFARRTWRTNRRVPATQLAVARWIVCPACKQVDRGLGYGRVEWNGSTLQVLTTSQKLAHRIARELGKAFRGRTTYRWSEDRTLVASWVRETSATARPAS